MPWLILGIGLACLSAALVWLFCDTCDALDEEVR